ncbi:protein-tyrosine-phosphatase [Maribacter sp. PR1]|uniref:Protein-tyrosine-phosphatase n=1 Tax=Maribacter cobaltidurans TaxID=1178778 RepID=A0ABU7IZS0_9FLAO|nr:MULTISPECIES: protein-tyrosine-phosphatase [Maribacter]MDC6391092.1 protein-tyrosine-phosphatase [Maribacter sp. PR1]MEE1978484.1 protein-tyrosine-phosphatase [Maribacter cobaltidurans]
MFKEIREEIHELKSYAPSAKRYMVLQSLIEYIQVKKNGGEDINLNFICTHNSRRSHLSQIWAQTMARYFAIDNVYCYSGGTESTALFPKVVETLRENGFKIMALSKGENPVYAVKYGASTMPIIGFSKTFDDTFNPASNFAAIMTCGHADENCPFIPGAEKRIPLTFDDPKAFDQTDLQTEKYKERSLEIASQLYFVFSKIV